MKIKSDNILILVNSSFSMIKEVLIQVTKIMTKS